MLPDGSLSRTQTGHSHTERPGAVLLRCVQESVRQQRRDSADCKVRLSSLLSQQFLFSEFQATTPARIKFSSFVVNREQASCFLSKQGLTHTYRWAFFLYRDKLVRRKVTILYSDWSIRKSYSICRPLVNLLCVIFSPPVCCVTIRRPMISLRHYEWAAL